MEANRKLSVPTLEEIRQNFRSNIEFASVGSLVKRGVLFVEDGNHGEYRPRQHEFVAEGVPFIRPPDLKDGRVDLEQCDRISDVAFRRVRKGIGQGGDIVLTHRATVGRLAIAEPDAPTFVANPGTTIWRSLDSTVLNQKYLYAFMRSSALAQQLDAQVGHTSTFDYVSLTQQRQLIVALPSIGIQERIADRICVFDDKIELNRRMNRVLEEMARAIFKAWFVEFEPVRAKAAGATGFPGMPQDVFEELPDSFVDSELGPIPKGWEVGVIAGLGRFVNGKAFTKHANGKGRMIIRIAELNSGPGPSTKYSDIEAAADNTAFPDDILFAWSGSLDVYRWHRDEAIINQHIFKVVPEGFPSWFVYYQLANAMPFFQQIASTKATTMGHIKRDHLSQATFAVPSNGIIAGAEEVMRSLYDLIHINERESLVLAATRDTLLPKLISGELQVGDES